MAAHRYKVEVQGQVQIGEILHDDEISPDLDRFDSVPDAVEDSVLLPHERTQILAMGNEKTRRFAYRHELTGTGEDLSICDSGLTLQYGIFGEPGSGKSNLLCHLLSQVVAHRSPVDPQGHDPARKFGGIILDPQAALLDDVRRVFADAERDDDLVVINSRALTKSGGINLIDSALSPRDLAKSIVDAAQTGSGDKDSPYWFEQIGIVFDAILTILGTLEPDRKPTLNRLVEEALGQHSVGSNRTQSNLEKLARTAEGHLVGTPTPDRQDVQSAIDGLRRHLSADPKNRITVEQFTEQAFGLFGKEAYRCYSAAKPGGRSLYDQIIDDGKVLLVSPGPHEVELSSTLPTLVKILFQRTVVSRFERYKEFQLNNRVRPVLFLADEYHTVATQPPGKVMSDSYYFSTARKFGGLCLVATQTVGQLQASGLGDNWHAIYGTLAAVIGMKVSDPDTVKYLQERGGQIDMLELNQGDSSKQGDITTSDNYKRTEVSKIPADTLKQFGQGDAVVIGSTGAARASIRYVHVPEWKPGRA
jgi:hypothetical protein